MCRLDEWAHCETGSHITLTHQSGRSHKDPIGSMQWLALSNSQHAKENFNILHGLIEVD